MNIRVIAPSFSSKLISEKNILLAEKRLTTLGHKVSYSSHFLEISEFLTSSVLSRTEDLHSAFADKSIDIVMSVIGGNSAVQLLRTIDWSIIGNSKSSLCGFSDTCVLQNAILAKTGKISYYGPHFSTFANPNFIDFTSEEFARSFKNESAFDLNASEDWGEGIWWEETGEYHSKQDPSKVVLQKGAATGTIVGGELQSFRLLQGTEYMPAFKKMILFLELNPNYSLPDLEKDLESLFYYYKKNSIKGLVFGRFPSNANISLLDLQRMISLKSFLKEIPIIAQASFGHTDPIVTFPIGGVAHISAALSEKTHISVQKNH